MICNVQQGPIIANVAAEKACRRFCLRQQARKLPQEILVPEAEMWARTRGSQQILNRSIELRSYLKTYWSPIRNSWGRNIPHGPSQIERLADGHHHQFNVKLPGRLCLSTKGGSNPSIDIEPATLLFSMQGSNDSKSFLALPNTSPVPPLRYEGWPSAPPRLRNSGFS